MRWRPPALGDPTTVLATATEFADLDDVAAHPRHAEPALRVIARQLRGRVRATARGRQEAPRSKRPSKSATKRDVSIDKRRSMRTVPMEQSPTWRRWLLEQRTPCHAPDTRSIRWGRRRLARPPESPSCEVPSVGLRAKTQPPASEPATVSTPGRSSLPSIAAAGGGDTLILCVPERTREEMSRFRTLEN